LRSFNVTNPATPIAGGTVNTGGMFRLDEMAFAPSSSSPFAGNNTIFAANNADSPAFASLISTASPLAPSLVTSPITIPGQAADGGMEQSVWNPNTGTWFVSVPNFADGDAGGVKEFSLTGTPLRTYNFTNMGIGNCGASGLALGGNGNLMVGCNPAAGNARAVVLNPAGTGSIVTTLPVTGTDELWYDPARNLFYVTGKDPVIGHRVIDIFDGTTYALLQEIDLTALGFGTGNMHSVAVDPLNGNIYVPIVGLAGSTICPNGCVAVFSVPEPPSFAIFLAGLLLAGLGMHLQLRRQSAASS
jgi:hypothetical protein